ncbi:hypothetical protein SAMN04487948_12839 [Halogranum amylolyticum]|uniref:Uncharacterized protein n=1 Tax=Halogranum amylolyticum TaxID=660520 RepID=A0A1H8WEP4_9EURY|nr:hypothetical protein SAMN04487948_12839 [Halogranum amylolyticum]
MKVPYRGMTLSEKIQYVRQAGLWNPVANLSDENTVVVPPSRTSAWGGNGRCD